MSVFTSDAQFCENKEDIQPRTHISVAKSLGNNI